MHASGVFKGPDISNSPIFLINGQSKNEQSSDSFLMKAAYFGSACLWDGFPQVKCRLGRRGYIRKVETRRRSSMSPNCIYGLDRGRRRNDIKTPVALRRGRCIICRRVVKRFQLVFSRAGPPPQPHRRGEERREKERSYRRPA